jgi:hypothetical protein
MRALLPPPVSSPSGSRGIGTEREVLPRHERHPRRVHGNENHCPLTDDDFPWPGDTEMDMDEVWPRFDKTTTSWAEAHRVQPL